MSCSVTLLEKSNVGSAILSPFNGIVTLDRSNVGSATVYCNLDEITSGAKTLIKVTNSDITHNLSPDAWAEAPLMGNNPVTSGSGGSNFTINSTNVTVNFTGVLGISSSIFGSGADAGLQFKAQVYINEVQQGEIALSHTVKGQGVQASIPFTAFNVTSGDLISVRTIKNTFSGTITIGADSSCSITLERL